MNSVIDVPITPSAFSYKIVVRKGCLDDIERYIPMQGKILVLTDRGVPKQYSEAVASKADCSYIYTIPQGEASKNIDNYCKILSFLKDKSFTRTDTIVAVGGGVVSDLAGFVAATYMRGISVYNVPTTLLSQVDASIGGKTAIDSEGIKNMVGVFNHPKAVIIDPNTLKTLSAREVHSGLVESIKMAATMDSSLFSLIEKSDSLEDDIETIITRSILLKKEVVCNDPLEKGMRRVLNFGHTVGHALEALGNGKYLHGEAVGMGMLCFSSPDVKKRIKDLLLKYSLPIHNDIPKEDIIRLIAHDKKASGDDVYVVLVEEIGSYVIRKTAIKDLNI